MSITLHTFSEFTLQYLNWLNDPEINRYTSRGVYPVTEGQAMEYLETCQSQERIVWAIFEQDQKHIGNISLQKIDLINRSAELAILIGEKSAHGKGYGLKAARLVCAHGFNALDLHRIYCGTHEDNMGMRKLAERLGMWEEGRSRQAFFKNGTFANVLNYGILKEEFIHADSAVHQGQSLPGDPGRSQGTPAGH